MPLEMISMRNNTKQIHQSIWNTLNLLTEKRLAIYHNIPLYSEANGKVNITWPNHIPGRYNCEQNFCKITQYKAIAEAHAYTCLLYDGAIVRASYSFEEGLLIKHSILWWPAPFMLDETDLELGGILDVFNLYAGSEDWHTNIQMRTPLRFDFDIKNSSWEHPSSHLHMQAKECRLWVDRPVCFNQFIKFIFMNFYQDIYTQHTFWNDLEYTHFYHDNINEQNASIYEHFAWGTSYKTIS